ncbi:hypothetical protein HPB52_012252 [Rhipicephalus sanguineus]|uniref:Uncharacterized protein n=1 Tax=Rhipicephalus sanguineus TaxID=34632 RepID=A0A9D4PZS5_RHISA|nr:hypothetical protein HPB52_012252 [Rhipicephalus sanguineus]
MASIKRKKISMSDKLNIVNPVAQDNNSEHEDKFPAVRLTSQQVIDCIDEVKEYFQLQQDDCSVEVL